MIQVLLNDDELVEPLAVAMLKRSVKRIQPTYLHTQAYLEKCTKKKHKNGTWNVDHNAIRETVLKDITAWQNIFKQTYKKHLRPLIAWLKSQIKDGKLSRSLALDYHQRLGYQCFSSTVAQHLSTSQQLITGDHSLDPHSGILIRHTVGNESLLRDFIAGDRSFWFLDSGYTNFLTGKKLWHRLVKDAIHDVWSDHYYPADRLRLLGSLPRPWQKSGSKILVIENSEHHYLISDITRESWRQSIAHDLEQHTDRHVVYKEKTPSRKDRQSVYQLLSQDPGQWYCVISDCSAAAVEAIWLGIPVITLQPHISQTVARTSISQINDLYRGPIGDWLCALSYHQFTREELMSGQALAMMKDYRNV